MREVADLEMGATFTLHKRPHEIFEKVLDICVDDDVIDHCLIKRIAFRIQDVWYTCNESAYKCNPCAFCTVVNVEDYKLTTPKRDVILHE